MDKSRPRFQTTLTQKYKHTKIHIFRKIVKIVRNLVDPVDQGVCVRGSMCDRK